LQQAPRRGTSSGIVMFETLSTSEKHQSNYVERNAKRSKPPGATVNPSVAESTDIAGVITPSP
jgi:hypothetical protein